MLRRARRADPRGGPRRTGARRPLPPRAGGGRAAPPPGRSSWPTDTLRDGLDVPTAVDAYAALRDIDVHTTLTRERGRPPHRVEHWWSGVLARELPARRTPC